MGKSIVSKGKNVKEAVSTALDLLDAGHSNVDIEIIETETRGILGMGSKPAVVRVTLKMAVPEEAQVPSQELLEEALDGLDLPPLASLNASVAPRPGEPFQKADLLGKVWVTDGHIYCKDAPDKYPLISPVPGVQLYKNNELVEQTVIASENDTFRVILQDEENEPSWELQLSDGKMEAILKVTPGIRIYRRLENKTPDHYIQLEVEEKRVPIFIETGRIVKQLSEMGVVNGLDYTEIADACMSETAGSFVIARGTPALPGKNGSFLPLQEVEVKRRLKERSDGTIDYRETQEFPSVERGQVLGVIQPPQPGVYGVTVTNEPILPPEVLPLTIKAGRGVILVENDTKAVATDTGHPDIKIKGNSAYISIIPKLLIGKDVDLQVGNVRYVGDVEIAGSVQDHMLVAAQGNLLVHHNVNMAKISAGKSIIVRNNIIASEATAGSRSLMTVEIHQMLGELIQQMKQMIAAMNQLSLVSAFKVSSFTRTGLGPLIKILCDGKMKSFPPLTKSLIDKIKSNAELLDEGWLEFAERLDKGFIRTQASDFKSIEDIVRLTRKAEQLHEATGETEKGTDCFIKAGFVYNSQLYSSGDIAIVGQGVFNSKLHAQGAIEIDGFFRGGDIYAEKGVKLGEAGTKGGRPTRIVVPHGETIKIKLAMEDVLIQIGSFTHKFTVQSSNVFARIGKEGQLLIF